MKIVVDENIEFGKEAFQHFGEVCLVHGRKITNDLLKDAEILIVRSITNVNEDLLQNTPVKFVGSTTIGTDHLDKEYLDSAKIRYTAAPGCNSFAVTEYVTTALAKIASQQNFDLTKKSLGVVGYGNIGKKITRFANAIGMQVLVNDPPLEREGFDYNFSSLDEALQCDIITLHVPMKKSGDDKTFHLLDAEKINSLKTDTILINSSRGAVVDNQALLHRLEIRNDLTVVLDVWENEPSINQALLEKVHFGTPHIAGYTYEGKVNGTVMIYNELCEFLKYEKNWNPILADITNKKINTPYLNNFTKFLSGVTKEIYSIENDTQKLKEKQILPSKEFAAYFDLLRKNYNLRREFNNFQIETSSLQKENLDTLQTLRFQLI